MEKKLVVRLKDIDYMKVKPRHLYGPLFFKTQLSDKVKIGHGKFQLAIRLPQLEGESKSEHKARYARLERLLLTR